MVDALMLFGSRIARKSPTINSARIIIFRGADQARLITWARVFVELHDPSLLGMRLVSGESTIAQKIGYATKCHAFFTEFYRRWYPDGSQAKTPADIRVDERTLAVWAVGALSSAGNAELLRLNAPQLDRGVAESMAEQIRALGFRFWVMRASDGWSIVVPPRDRQRFEAWVDDRIPDVVWRTA